jgi:hypothetical protein
MIIKSIPYIISFEGSDAERRQQAHLRWCQFLYDIGKEMKFYLIDDNFDYPITIIISGNDIIGNKTQWIAEIKEKS